MLQQHRASTSSQVAEADDATGNSSITKAITTSRSSIFVALDRDSTTTWPYDEPWGWMQPTRHALGALLLEQGRIDEAEAVYRADLGLDDTLSRATQHPNNLWSLFGLHECLVARGAAAEAVTVRHQLDLAGARADVPVAASCFCHQAALATVLVSGGDCCD